MPYTCVSDGRKWVLQKKDGSKSFGSHATKRECQKQMRAIYAHEMVNLNPIRIDGYVRQSSDFNAQIASDADTINVLINSEGGSFTDAIIMHNKLRSTGKKVKVYIEAYAYSAAAVLALAGDEICIAENGLIAFHPVNIQPTDYTGKSAKELEDLAEMLKKADEQLVNTLMSKTGKTKEECTQVMSKITWFTPEEALAFGIVDDIIPIMRDMQIENYWPERIVNFVKGKQNMPMKEICDQFGVEATAENAEEKLVEFINGLRTTQPKPAPVISNAIVNMIKRSRETDLSMLLTNGKIIPAVANEMRTKYLTDERVRIDLQTDNEEFNNLTNSFSKNEPVLSFGGKASTQILSKEQQDREKNVLIEDAKKRVGK